MVAALGYEAYRRFFGSTSRDQKGELQLMVQVGPLAHALFAAKAGSAEQADYSLIGIAEQYEEQEEKVLVFMISRRSHEKREKKERFIRLLDP